MGWKLKMGLRLELEWGLALNRGGRGDGGLWRCWLKRGTAWEFRLFCDQWWLPRRLLGLFEVGHELDMHF